MKRFKQIIKITISLTLLFLISLVSFFVWASSPHHSTDDYNLLVKESVSPVSVQDSVHSIMTYNIGFLSGMTNNRAVKSDKELYDNNLNQILDKFKVLDIDIACLQEVDFDSDRSFNVNQHSEIQKVCFPFGCQAINWDENYLPFPGGPTDFKNHYGSIYSGQSVLSKFPVNANHRWVLDRPSEIAWHRDAFYLDRLVQELDMTIEGKLVKVFNVHLEAFDKGTRKAQIQQLKDIIKPYAQSTPVLVVGDFNSDLNKEGNHLIKLLDIPHLKAAHTGDKSESLTFPSNKPIKRIDYVFYNSNFIEMQDAKVLNEFGTISDHLPVMMLFKFNE